MYEYFSYYLLQMVAAMVHGKVVSHMNADLYCLKRYTT